MAKHFYRTSPKRAAANARFAKACEDLAQAEEAYRVDKSPASLRRVMQARRAFAEARAEQIATRDMA
jgi:hypothetical protein